MPIVAGGYLARFESHPIEPISVYCMCGWFAATRTFEDDGVIVPILDPIDFRIFNHYPVQADDGQWNDLWSRLGTVLTFPDDGVPDQNGNILWMLPYGNKKCVLENPPPVDIEIPKEPARQSSMLCISIETRNGDVIYQAPASMYLAAKNVNNVWAWRLGCTDLGLPPGVQLPTPIEATTTSKARHFDRKKSYEYPATSGGWCRLNQREERYTPATKLIRHSFDNMSDVNGVKNYLANWPIVNVVDTGRLDLPESGIVSLKSYDANNTLLSVMPIEFHRQEGDRYISGYIFCMSDPNQQGIFKDWSDSPYVCIYATTGGHLEVSLDNFQLLSRFMACWLCDSSCPCSGTFDFDGDGIVNFADYAKLVR